MPNWTIRASYLFRKIVHSQVQIRHQYALPRKQLRVACLYENRSLMLTGPEDFLVVDYKMNVYLGKPSVADVLVVDSFDNLSLLCNRL